MKSFYDKLTKIHEDNSLRKRIQYRSTRRINKQILKNIIETSYFPNLLFYGPPGTGKTTTIINLINEFQLIHFKF